MIWADFFKRDMEVKRHQTHSSILPSPIPEGLWPWSVTDSERTFATYLGAAVELSEEDITSDIFSGFDMFYIEGYLISNLPLMHKALRLAKTA